ELEQATLAVKLRSRLKPARNPERVRHYQPMQRRSDNLLAAADQPHYSQRVAADVDHDRVVPLELRPARKTGVRPVRHKPQPHLTGAHRDQLTREKAWISDDAIGTTDAAGCQRPTDCHDLGAFQVQPRTLGKPAAANDKASPTTWNVLKYR